MQRPTAEALDVYGYPTPPVEFAVLVVPRVRLPRSTPFTDFLIQSNAERRRYPALIPAGAPAVRLRHVR